MSWWQVSIITLLVYWVVGVLIYEIKGEDEDFAVSWSMGVVFPILYILFYPLRVWKHYKLNIKVYKKYNLSFWEKLIGKGLCNGKKMWNWEIKKFYKNREKGLTMKFSEAMRLLEEGKKVRVVDWDKCSYICYSNIIGQFVDEKHNVSEICGIDMNSEWEEYIGPVEEGKIEKLDRKKAIFDDVVDKLNEVIDYINK